MICMLFAWCDENDEINVTSNQTLRVHCTNVVQLWTRVKSEFEPSSAVNCVAPKRFKRWSPFNSELPSDHRSNFDLGSTRGYACALGNKYFLWYYCCKKIVQVEFYPVQKTSSYRIIRLLMQLYWWSGFVRFLLYSFYVLFVLDKLTNRWINHIFRWRCLIVTVNIRSNPNHSNKNSFISIYKTSNLIILLIWIC